MFQQYSMKTATSVGVDAGLRAYFLRVYNYMASAVLLTGLVAYFISTMAITEQGGQMQLTSFGAALFNSPLKWVVMLAPFGLVMFLSARIHAMSQAGAQLAFWIFSIMMGVSLTSIFLIYTGESIARVFFITSATFGLMSLYGYTTKKDLTSMGSFLIMGALGLFVASIANMFFQNGALSFAISVVGVLVFTGLTAYDTQNIKKIYYQLSTSYDAERTLGKAAIMGALNLYMDFINIFIMLMQLVGDRR
ncbi:MAG: Bax inhibitor-1/YccA family protein [Alphaproteobacteria bacterium]|nr:MAG: Bax inhibitor-1/YccA family protein [Alphaproteobacteria bacterium]TAF13666.1 MAG: Bax inhibitor-1/YccA family protein [Alphaproteobacteria bacterium]TAF39587.1 MAG: Bax inhibitor-1/YccA family protein [Alphaproteobacteria bacterium]TAF75379.1 MAG: Bax inhibitor-1/YccA family protein [Alphaproteobacteria bacterium]